LNIDDFLEIIKKEKGYDLDKEQKSVVKHGDGPLWVVAGPGSGKTEVLVLRTLKLIFVDALPPSSIIITTFTEKAANNLFERILNYTNLIFEKYPDLEQAIDIHELKIGTLHSLCNDIMLENKYPEYENYRLLDELEQYLFIFEHCDFVKDRSDKYMPLCKHFSYLFNRFDPVAGGYGWKGDKLPNKWRRTSAAISLFNRSVEDYLDLDKMREAKGLWDLFLEAYDDYLKNLEDHRRCDFAHLQEKFLQFLETPLGERFLKGDDKGTNSGINYVLVDEYQDTNPIQEAIYLKLTQFTYNLCVVGDDDQALYRFRGGTVDCMVTFKKACVNVFSIEPEEVAVKYLNSNYRSHPNIVNYYDDYIKSFKSMRLEGARVEGKPSLRPKSKITGDYPAIGHITGKTIEITAEDFAILVKDLLENQIIEQPSECALLMRSVRESPRNAGPFASALRNLDIPVYNPRSKSFLEQEEIAGALGAFLSIIDPDFSALNAVVIGKIKDTVEYWVKVYKNMADDHPELSEYVNKSVSEIGKVDVKEWVGVNILDIFYRILAHEPFNEWKEDVEKTYRLGMLSNIFETYAAIPYPGYPGSNRGELRTSGTAGGIISFRWRTTFYYALIGLLSSKGLDDPEDEQLISPPDRLPIMTVHQAKGLEFPFVFVYGLKQKIRTDDSILIEDAFSDFKKNPPLVNFSPEERAEHDMIRFYYVAYSRAKYALIHIIPKAHLESGYLGFIGKNTRKFLSKSEDVGV
jgi:DNA helicase-2/ATP-dependent DNA helicase PcrA